MSRVSFFFLLILILGQLNIELSMASQKNTKKNTIRLTSPKKLESLKKYLEKKDIAYEVTTKDEVRPVYHLLLGPFDSKNQRERLLKFLEKMNREIKIIQEGRYVFIGTYKTRNDAARVVQRLELKRFGQPQLLSKEKKMSVYNVVRKTDSTKNETLTLSRPPRESTETVSGEDLSTTSISGWSRLLGAAYVKQKDHPAQLKLVISPELSAEIKDGWQASLGFYSDALFDVKSQESRFDLQTHKTSLAFDFLDTSITLGAQVLSWGRVYENSILDRLSRQNFRHGNELDYDERLMSQWALRAKGYLSSTTLDFIFSPYFQTNKYSPNGDLWSPVSKKRGRILGFPKQDLLAALINSGSFSEEDSDRFAAGLRLTHGLGEGSEIGASIIRSPSQNPYYTVNPEVVGRLLGGEPIPSAIANTAGETFITKYPTQLFIGVDGVAEIFESIYRLEVGWLDKMPATEASSFIYNPQSAILWNLSTEIYLNQGVNTLNLMLSGNRFLTEKELLDYESTYFLSTRYEWPFDRDRWVFELNAQLGLHADHLTIAPKMSYQGLDHQSYDFSFSFFSGEEQSFGDYYKDNMSLRLSWRYDL